VLRQRGLSLVELMVAVTLALLTALVVLQVLTVFEARKRTTTRGNDAQVGAAIGLFMVERELRMAGAGLMRPGGFACNAGVNVYHDGDVILDAQPLAPVLVVDGGDGGVDTVRTVRSSAAFGTAHATIVKSMPTPSSILTVDDDAGLAEGDLFIAGSPEGNKVCTLMQMTKDAEATGNGWNLTHNSGLSDYNPPNPDKVFAGAVAYDIGDIVFNLGSLGMRAVTVVCDDGNAPAAGNRCDLVGFDPFVTPANPTLDDVESIVGQVVDFQVQYGVAPAGGQTVDEWVDATGATWGNPDLAAIARIKALRIAVVTRGNREPQRVSPEQIVIWDAGEATERVRALGDEERRYRYRVLTSVVPLVNVIWAGI
jgi:type IV pilus assembly protein PilW